MFRLAIRVELLFINITNDDLPVSRTRQTIDSTLKTCVEVKSLSGLEDFTTAVERNDLLQTKAKPLLKKNLLFCLPDELLVEIAMELLWRDLVYLRQTCTRLRGITKSLAIWRSLARREPRQTLCLELPIESYTCEELESHFLLRKSAEVRYEKGEKGLPFSQRILPIKMALPLDSASLVPGGRWLLISTSRGSVNYYDLNSEDYTGRELIPERYIERRSSMCIDTDWSSSILKFNLALTNLDYTQVNRQADIEVWQVNLVVDAQGKGIALSAKSLSHFLQEPAGTITSIALVDDLFAYSLSFTPHDDTWYVFVVNWKTTRGTGYPKKVKLIAFWSPTSVILCG
ncbi:hypothetical protein BDN72DRAFT_855235 [Pluteus cervinus]|uniref:Uncharacterized protein n=1 Tax=Pluteus cervinus TaxID=181527 RepID=A0ACD3B5E0_9AGAR|nr:hypothetical protein BDN72DRAFT_855235 [Pluteus cervinus]